VLIGVRAASVNPIDWQLRSGALKSVNRLKLPAVLGVDLAGEVVEVTAGSRFKVGDAVVASMPHDVGAFAEFVVAPETVVAPKPANLSFEQAGSFPAVALTALQCLRDLAKLKPGQSVLVNGASGGVGLFGVQLAKVLGAGSVTAVCGARGFDLVKGLGADELIDYRSSDFTKLGKKWDVILDAVHQHGFVASRQALAKPGAHVATSPPNWFAAFARQTLLNPFSSQKAYVVLMKTNAKDLEYLSGLFDAGKLKAVLDKTYPLAQVAEAQTYSATGRAQGKIVLKF
jgi:NADPH:quinone reductase-like Zn-dependent oxidoreductase